MKVISVLALVLLLSLAVGVGIASATDSGLSVEAAVGQDIVQPLALPDSSSLIFVPLNPCRIIDTRVAGGKIAAGSTRNFIAWGANYSGQGGYNGTCGVDDHASAIAVTLTSTQQDGAGNLRAWPYTATMPTASVLNYKPGADIANSTILPIYVYSPTYDFSIYANVSGTHVVADVVGYFKKRVPTVLTIEDGPGSFSANTALCETADYTPVVNSRALLDGQLSVYSSSPVSYGMYIKYSSDGGSTWSFVTNWFSWATANSTWGVNALSDTLDLTAGTPYRFAIMSDVAVTGDSRCHLRANIVER